MLAEGGGFISRKSKEKSGNTSIQNFNIIFSFSKLNTERRKVIFFCFTMADICDYFYSLFTITVHFNQNKASFNNSNNSIIPTHQSYRQLILPCTIQSRKIL